MSTEPRGLRDLFARIAGTYELSNHLLTAGLDFLWRRRAVRRAAGEERPARSQVRPARGQVRWLDVCTGTGDMARLLRRWAGPGALVVGLDFSAEMLAQAAAHAQAGPPAWVLADVKRLPFAGETFDLVTLSFGTRNISPSREALLAALAEIHRVLRPGGRFVNVETSQPPSRLVRALFHAYARTVIEPLGRAISGSREAYRYLAYTIPRFYTAEALAELMHQVGFGAVAVERMTLGAVAIHEATKDGAPLPHSS